ncbi:MAG TPA: Maf-like protein [Flavobacterium sp.]|nr:Maf-like protein [Flavobacterium sp.]
MMLARELKNHQLILASGSPRRQQFFKDLALDFEIRLKEIEETYPENLKASEVTDYLALLKANAFELKSNEILVTSDTIVWLEDKVIGKPKNYEDAFVILKELSNKTHQVITSVCLKSVSKTKVFNVITKVTFAELTHEMIGYYIDTYKPFDKAGAYGIQEWIGLVGIEKIEGSYTNVVGLPTEKFYKELLCFIR